MFHCLQDVLHEFQHKDDRELKAILKTTVPYSMCINTFEELKRYYWMWSAVVQDGLDRMRRVQLTYHQSRQNFDKLRMGADRS